MQNNKPFLIGIGLVTFIILALLNAAFIVNETEQAIILQFGEPQGEAIKEPGLHFKAPFIQNVIFFDKRLLDLNLPVEEVIAADQKRLVVDSFTRYKITNPLLFYQAVRSEPLAEERLKTLINSNLRSVLGQFALTSVLSPERARIMNKIQQEVNQSAENFGIQIIDLRIRRADLPEQNSEAIFKRMISERKREAREIRAFGEELAQEIRAKAEKERTILLADAERQAKILQGEGDAKALKISREAYNKDPSWYRFYRSLEAYKKSLTSKTKLILSPESDFFKAFKNLKTN